MESRNPLLLTVRALISVIDGADALTRGHSARIARYAVRVAKKLGVPEAQWETIELGALLHDLGRIAVLRDVLSRPGALDSGERALMQAHAAIGWEMIRDIPGLEAAAEIVQAHHEQPDGKGYPRGLTADRIPMGARIVMVCAAYDAMTEERPYRRGLPREVAIDELRRHSGTQFFPDVVDAFVKLVEGGELWDGFPVHEREIYLQGHRNAA
jgi:putative nucleotidyltransferase with HDIG domain